MRTRALALLALTACEAGLPASRLPRSTASLEVPPAEATITVTADEVRVDGTPIVSTAELLAGAEDAASAVHRALEARADVARAAAARDPSAPAFRGALAVELDRDLSSEALLASVDAGARSGFALPWVVVADAGGHRHGIKLTIPEVAAAAVASAAPATVHREAGYANPTIRVSAAEGITVQAADRVVDAGEGLVLPCPTKPCGDDWPLVELTRVVRRIKLDHPSDRAAMVVPAPDASVQAVVRVLDATRSDALAGPGTRDLLPDALLARSAP